MIHDKNDDISINAESGQSFSTSLLRWFDRHGRKSLPWQQNRNAWRIWVSEIMLQQTQVQTVIPYYQNFMSRYPDIRSLADADQDEVLSHWAGLGYYARARNLHRAARQICQQHGGEFPTRFEDVIALPGIGRSTAGAILAFFDNQRHPVLDGNVKRVLTRCFGIFGYPGGRTTETRLWEIADRLTPKERVADYTQAIMDLGATLCTRSGPGCQLCPIQPQCVAFDQNLQSRLPESRPAKVRPVRNTRMLLIRNNQSACLLLKRPPTGIWGGLWSLPEITEPDIDHQQWCRDELGLEVDAGTTLSEVSHAFTHFQLKITPIMCAIISSSGIIRDGTPRLWYNPTDRAGSLLQTTAPSLHQPLTATSAPDTRVALPSAVRKLLNLLKD